MSEWKVAARTGAKMSKPPRWWCGHGILWGCPKDRQLLPKKDRAAYDTREDGPRTRCTRLDSSGKRCRRLTRRWEAIHENPEFSMRWFYVPVCKQHEES